MACVLSITVINRCLLLVLLQLVAVHRSIVDYVVWFFTVDKKIKLKKKIIATGPMVVSKPLSLLFTVVTCDDR